MMNIKVAVCDHFLKAFCEKVGDFFIEEKNNLDCACNNTLTYPILICDNCSNKIWNCSITRK